MFKNNFFEFLKVIIKMKAMLTLPGREFKQTNKTKTQINKQNPTKQNNTKKTPNNKPNKKQTNPTHIKTQAENEWGNSECNQMLGTVIPD